MVKKTVEGKPRLRLIHKHAPFPKEKPREDILTKSELLEFMKEHLKTLNKAVRQMRINIKELEQEIKFERKLK